MAAEKKPRAAKAETKTTKTTATKKVVATKPKIVRARKPKAPAITAEQVAERAYYIWAEAPATIRSRTGSRPNANSRPRSAPTHRQAVSDSSLTRARLVSDRARVVSDTACPVRACPS